MYIYTSSYSSTVYLFIHCFHILDIVNNAAMNMRDHIYFQVSVFLPFRSMPKSRIAGSHYCPIFNFSQNHHIIFNSTYTNLHSYQQWTRVPFFPHLHQNLFLVLLTTTFLKNMWWYHIVALICISLMVNNVEHLFMYLASHLYVFLEKNLFRSSHHFVRFFFFFAIELYELVMLGAISFSSESSQPGDRTDISCTGKWILYQCATWEALCILNINSWFTTFPPMASFAVQKSFSLM